MDLRTEIEENQKVTLQESHVVLSHFCFNKSLSFNSNDSIKNFTFGSKYWAGIFTHNFVVVYENVQGRSSIWNIVQYLNIQSVACIYLPL